MEVVQTRYGQLIVSPHDLYVGRSLIEYGEFSEGEVELFRQLIRPEDVVCDIGANIGAHTLAFSRMAAHVHAFEPQPLLYSALAGMIALNELTNVTAYHAGIYSREGILSCPSLVFDRPNNLGASSLLPYGKASIHVRVKPMDIACNFLKIDVEGMELDVLRGAAAMIREHKPVLYVEADRRDKYDALVAYIRQLGYHPYWHTPSLFNPGNFRGRADDIWGDVASFNLLCSPKPIPDSPLKPAGDWPNFAHKDFHEQIARMTP